jgi:hypothetical protein
MMRKIAADIVKNKKQLQREENDLHNTEELQGKAAPFIVR